MGGRDHGLVTDVAHGLRKRDGFCGVTAAVIETEQHVIVHVEHGRSMDVLGVFDHITPQTVPIRPAPHQTVRCRRI